MHLAYAVPTTSINIFQEVAMKNVVYKCQAHPVDIGIPF